MPQNTFDDESALIQVMAWCHQATSHYLSQCWPRSVSPYGTTRPQWVKHLKLLWTWSCTAAWWPGVKLVSVSGVRHLGDIGSDNGLALNRSLAITWTNASILSIGPLGTSFCEIWIKIYKMHYKMLSAKWWPFCSGLNKLIHDNCWSHCGSM